MKESRDKFFRRKYQGSKPRIPRIDLPCLHKRRFVDECQAMAVAAVSLEERNTGISRLFVYKCPGCFGWHLTSKSGSKERMVVK